MHSAPAFFALVLPLLLTACLGSGGDSQSTPPLPTHPDDSLDQDFLPPVVNDPSIPAFKLLSVELASVAPRTDKIKFTWDGNPLGFNYTVCLEDKTKVNHCFPLGHTQNETYLDLSLFSLLKTLNKRVFILASQGEGVRASNMLPMTDKLLTDLIQYIKPLHPDASDYFGKSVVLSRDGKTLIVSATSERSNAVGIGGDQTDNSLLNSGAVFVFQRTIAGWHQQTYIKASNSKAEIKFGESLAISADGKTIAVGAPYESAHSTGVNGNEISTSALASGAVYIFTLNGDIWKQTAYVKASNTGKGDHFGNALSLNEDGSKLAVGAKNEDSDAKTVDGDQSNDFETNSGAVYLFSIKNNTWSQDAYIKASNAQMDDFFGAAVNLNAQGNVLAISATGEDSNATGINANQADNSQLNAGAVYIFHLEDQHWVQKTYIKASTTGADDNFGSRLSFNAIGDILAVSAPGEDANSKGINGDEKNNAGENSGAAYVFRQSKGTWKQEAFIKSSNSGQYHFFGSDISLSDDGATLAVSAPFESSNAIGLNGDKLNTSSRDSGAAYLFTYNKKWEEKTYIKAINTRPSMRFGQSISLSGNADTFAAGAIGDSSNAGGINGDHLNTELNTAGAVFVY